MGDALADRDPDVVMMKHNANTECMNIDGILLRSASLASLVFRCNIAMDFEMTELTKNFIKLNTFVARSKTA